MVTRVRTRACPPQTTVPHAPPAEALPLVPYQRPELPPADAILRAYALAEDARWYANFGPCTSLLADRVAARLGGERPPASTARKPPDVRRGGLHVVPVASATAGLLAALRVACGTPTERRRHVVTPAFTFTATAGAVRWAGFEPLFADIDRDAWQLDPGELDRVLAEQGGRVAGVLATTTFGTAPNPATRAAWRATCERHGVPLVVDAAAAFGAVDRDGRPAGHDGDLTVFSLHATKPAAAGEGGLVVTGDADTAAHLRRIVNFGIDPDTRDTIEAGFNGKLSELGAATALAMLDGLDDVLTRRRSHVADVRGRLDGLPVTVQAGAEGSTWQILQLGLPDGRARRAALGAARDLRVEARTCFDPPLHRHTAYAGAPVAGDLRGTEHVAARALSLPMANDLSAEERERIAEVVRRAFA